MVKREIEETKDLKELEDMLLGLVKSCKKAVADGFQAGQDLPVIVTENLNGFMTGLSGLENLSPAYKEKLFASIRSNVNFGIDMAEALIEEQAE